MAITNTYLKGVYDTVVKRNQNEPEFQQAEEQIIGKVAFRFWPLSKMGFLK